ncbi:probable ATP-dependent RNA helicase DHX35 isoform X2 [Plodia interpunctella]|uniref:probable ATP-dependent RNA helicase DHX35 isoform X2 n=1 Tax=Plodia interpunctella TaxID=58824 RepID=UPI00236804F2|nr:probable ATP-dependent RNA helicase DHX35 isoform X2 [Plodia interpunctella]
MHGARPKFIKPGDESLYPSRNSDGTIEVLTNPSLESALITDNDSKTTFVYNRYHHLPLEVQRQKLPVFQYRNHILYLLENYQTLVLIGETGCGKSTQVPQFMTEGVLLREMFASPLLMQYSCIVLDEVHERTQMTDVLMGLLKKIARKRKNLKLVISSATMDADFLKNFFDLSNKGGSSTSVIMSIQGRTHPIDIFYVEEPVPDYVNATIDTVIKIHENEPFGDILAFLTSQEEILTARETLNLYAEQNNEKNKHRKFFSSGIQSADMEVLPMYGSLPHYAQVKVFQMRNQNVRKVILATNVAETSVTIPGITYVIDSGFHKLAYFDPVVGVQCVRAAPVSRNNATQRSGRVGRARSGKCYRLYTEEQYDKLPVCVPPEMCRSDLSSMLLQLKALGINNVLKFTFPTPPPAKCLLSGLETLYALKIIDKQGNLTEIGKQAAELPLKPMCAVILCNGGEFGCIQEILSIVAMLQVDNVFIKPSGKQNMAAKISRRNNFEVAEGDLIMYLNIFDAYQKVKLTHTEEKKAIKACKDWCNKMYLNYRVMEKAAEIRDSLEKLIKTKFKIENKIYEGVELGPAKCERIMKCVVSGLFPQSAFLYTDSSYRGIRGATLHISPDSCLYNTQQPQWLVFAGVQSTGDKIYMRQVMTIKKEWLTELAPHYYVEN